MALPATSLYSRLEEADALIRIGRIGAARMAFNALLEASQDRQDQSTETIARAMLAACAIRYGDLDGARARLDEARERAQPDNIAAEARLRAVEVRLTLADDDTDSGERAVHEYVGWAEDHRSWPQAVDGYRLLADIDATDRAFWLRRAVQTALDYGLRDECGNLYNDLAIALDGIDRADEAFEAYRQALAWYRRTGTTGQVAAACWAVGSVAVQQQDWGTAESHLAEAIRITAGGDEHRDIHAIALSDLARIHAASGDVVEARRVMIRALAIAREVDLPDQWPERWATMAGFARELELDL